MEIRRLADEQPTRPRALGLASLLLAAVALFVAPSSDAVEFTVTAEFKPSLLEPGKRDFVNTTKPAFFCGWRPDICGAKGIYMFDVNTNISKIWGESSDTRSRHYVGSPGRKTVTITNRGDGSTSEVIVDFIALSGRVDRQRSGTITHYLRGGCTELRIPAVFPLYDLYQWSYPTGGARAGCYALSGGSGVQTLTYPYLGIGLSIQSADPTTLANGVYEGRLVYTIGDQSADLDFGNSVSGDSEIALNFVFSVTHDFQVTFPNAAPRVTLAPVGGWRQWTDHGNAPVRLQQELPFILTSSNAFSVKMICEHESDQRCGIKDQASNVIVPIDVDVSMPGMREVATAQPAIQTLLVASHTGVTAPRFSPDSYLMNRLSKLRFSANGAAVTEMLKAPDSRWQGDVTVVFDSDP